MTKQYPTKQYLSEVLSSREFAESVPTEIVIVMARQLLAGLEQEPVAGEARFQEERHWSPCTAAHVAMVLANPADWPKYEVRYLYAAPQLPQPAVVPEGLRMALSNAGIAAPESDEMLFAAHEKYTQMLVSWVKDRKPFKPAVVPGAYVTAEHRRVIGMLLAVCGAAFELADDSCQQDVDGEECHVVPADSFKKLSDTLNEIENTLPDEYEYLPNTVLQWAAVPRHALQAMLQGKAEPAHGWIPCSERMPEVGSTIMVYMDKPQHSSTDYAITTFDKYGFSRAKVTHWMPLPAAPQQEVR